MNLPGSRGGVKDGLAVVVPLLRHAVEQIEGSDHERGLADRPRVAWGGAPADLATRPGCVASRPSGQPRLARSLGRHCAVALPGTTAQLRLDGPFDASRGARRTGQLPFVVQYDGRFVGQLTVGGIVCGSAHSPPIGYWIDERFAGRGMTTRAVAMAIDHCFGPVGLHRIEVTIRPENPSSLRVVDKLGFREIGSAPRFLHIDGDWRDHQLFAITRDEVPMGLVRRLDAADSHQEGLPEIRSSSRRLVGTWTAFSSVADAPHRLPCRPCQALHETPLTTALTSGAPPVTRVISRHTGTAPVTHCIPLVSSSPWTCQQSSSSSSPSPGRST